MILGASLGAILLGRSCLRPDGLESLSNHSQGVQELLELLVLGPRVGVYLYGSLFLLSGGQLILQELDCRLTRQPFHLIVLFQQDLWFLQDGAELDDGVSTAVRDLDVKQVHKYHLLQSVLLAVDIAQLIPDLMAVLGDSADPGLDLRGQSIQEVDY